MKIYILTIILSNFLIETSYAKNSYFEEGKKLFDNKKYLDSKFYFEKDIVFNPKSENSYLYLARIFKEGNKDTLEENNLNTVLLLNPKNEEAIYFLTLLNIKKSNFLKAKELIDTMASVCEKMCTTKIELQEKLKSSQKSK
jgi:tetratricopeptide (TPR) repeat protein